MDGAAEELYFPEATGIVGKAWEIVRREGKLLVVIALTLLLPLSFVIHGHSLISETPFNKIMINKLLLGIDASNPASESVRNSLPLQMGELFAFSLLSRSAIVYTVASIYSGNEMCYSEVMSIAPRVWKRLVLAFLWFFFVTFLYHVVTGGTLLFWVLIHGVVGLEKGTIYFGILVIVIIASFFHVYIVMVWELARGVCVVEDRHGLGTMKNSKQLMKGKRDTALTLYLLYALLIGVIGGIQSYSAYAKQQGAMHIGVIVAVVVLQCGVDLVWLLTHAVLYFVCKSYHHEDIDMVALSNHLEMYNERYMLLHDASMQFEMFGPQRFLGRIRLFHYSIEQSSEKNLG